MNQNPLPTEGEMDRILQGILFAESSRGKKGLSRKGDALIKQAGGIEKAISAEYGANPELMAHLRKERKKETEGDERNTAKKIRKAFKAQSGKEYEARMARKRDMHAKENIESLNTVLAEGSQGIKRLRRVGDAKVKKAGGISKVDLDADPHFAKEVHKYKEIQKRVGDKAVKQGTKREHATLMYPFSRKGRKPQQEDAKSHERWEKGYDAWKAIKQKKEKTVAEATDYILRHRIRNGRIQEETLTESRSRKTAVKKVAEMRPLKDRDKKSLRSYLRKNPGKLDSLAAKYGSENLGRAYDDDDHKSEPHPHKKPNGST